MGTWLGFVCVNALHSSLQFFSHVGEILLYSWIESREEDKVSCVKNTTQWCSQNSEKIRHQEETTGTSSDSFQLRPVSK